MPFYFDPLSTCDVCLEHFAPPGSGEDRDGKTPHVLPCGHVFCLDCLINVQGPCPTCRTSFRHDRIHRVHVDTSRDASPPDDVHNALRSIYQAVDRVRHSEERSAGLNSLDLDDLLGQIQAFVQVHADKAILDIVYCISTVLEKYAEMALQTAAYEQRIRRHEREEADERRRRDTLETTYMDTIARLEEELQNHSIPSPLPPPSQRLGAPSPAAGSSRARSAASAMSRSVSREERQRSIQYEAEMRLQEEEAGEPSWRREAVDQGNALGLDRPRPRSSSTSGGLQPETSASAERRARTEHRRGSSTRQREADALLSPVDLTVDAPSSSRVPYHPGRTQAEPSGNHSRPPNRQERSTARHIYRENDDAEGGALGLGVPTVSRRSNSTTPFIPPTPLNLGGDASPRIPFIPPPPPDWRDSLDLPPETPPVRSTSTTRANRQPPAPVPYIPSPPREPANIPASTSRSAQSSRHNLPAPYIPSPPREPTTLPSSTSANIYAGRQAPATAYFPSPLPNTPALPNNTSAPGSTSHSRSHSLHRGHIPEATSDSQHPRRPAAQPAPTAPPYQSTSRRTPAPAPAHTPHPNPPGLPESSHHRSRGRSFSGQPEVESRYVPRQEPTRPVILPTPAAGPSISTTYVQQQPTNPLPSAMRVRSRSISGPAPVPPPGPPHVQAAAADTSRPGPTPYTPHSGYAPMPGMSRRPTAPPSVASSTGSGWSTAPTVGVAPQAAHPQYGHGRHPSIDAGTPHSRHPPLSRHPSGRRPSIDASGSSTHRPPPVAIPPSSATSSGHQTSSGNPFTPTHPLAYHSGLPVTSQSGYPQATPYPYGGGGYVPSRSAPDSSGPPPLARSAPGSSMHTPAPMHASISQPQQGQRPQPAPRQESNNLLF